MSKKFHFATWAHRVSNFGDNPQEVKQHVKRLSDAGFELIIPCVKNPPGYVDFKTDVAEVNPDYPDWDPLKILAEVATENNMKVHPWFCIFPEGEHSVLLKKSPHVAAVHESSRMRWACACRPEVQEYELALYESVADNYPIHGLHLDYMRTGGVCRCDYCKEQMAAKGIEVSKVSTKDPEFGQWVDWRCERITSFVEKMRELTHRKNIELSAAVFADLPSCRNSNGQDWGEWAEKSLVDFMFPMNYDNSTRNVRLRTRQHVALVSNYCPVWEGLGKASSNSQLTTKVMVDQISVAKEEGAKGVVLFHYPALSDEDLSVVKEMNTPTNIRAIVFDVGGVLADDMHGPLLKDLAKFYQDLQKNAIVQAGDEPWKKLRLNDISEDEFWDEVIKAGKLKESVDDLKRMLRQRMRVFWGPMSVVERLKCRGYTLAILSNHGKAWFEYFAERFRFYDLFDERLVVVSYDINCAKPSEDAFERLMERLRVYPDGTMSDIKRSECLFIDDKKRNTIAAESFDLEALQFDAREQSAGDLVRLLSEYGINAEER